MTLPDFLIILGAACALLACLGVVADAVARREAAEARRRAVQ